MTDATVRIRPAGGMNYAFRATAACVCARAALEVHLLIGGERVQGYFSPVLSPGLTGRPAKLRTGNIGTRDNDICRAGYESENVCRYF